MEKKIIWLDDQFTKIHRYLLKYHIEMIGKHADIIECSTLVNFVEAIKKEYFDGIILDVMLKHDRATVNYALLGKNNVNYISTEAGLQIAKIIKNVGDYATKNDSISNVPILILTNEHDDPEQIYKRYHKEFFKSISSGGDNKLKILSKGMHDEKRIEEWVQVDVKKDSGFKYESI